MIFPIHSEFYRILICHQNQLIHHLLFRVFFDYIYEYSTASTSDAAYIIGGGYRKMSQIIVEFKNDQWTRMRRGFKSNKVCVNECVRQSSSI